MTLRGDRTPAKQVRFEATARATPSAATATADRDR
jgi:hypothetical protein